LEKSIPLKNNSVDFIHANDSIHYIVNSNKLFSEIKRVSKKNTFISLVHINKNRLRNKELFKKSIESYKIFLRKLRYKTVLELSDKLLWERVHNYKTIILNKQQFKYRYQIFSFFASKKKLPEKLLFDKKEFLKINRINKFSYDNLF
jgi:ubiquinone/menaquinone biosynthesis C-methylase UbiE